MELEIEMPISEIVKRFPSAATLFEKYDLDYCCHGRASLQEACEGDLTKYARVKHALQELFENQSISKDYTHFENKDIDVLVDYIIQKHHSYTKEAMATIVAHLQKVSSKHNHHHPELKQIFELFDELKKEMDQHMMKEEEILFPRIKMLNNVYQSRELQRKGVLLKLSGPIGVMEMEHEKAGSIMHLIRELTHNFSPPIEACTAYHLCFNELKEFEEDLHQHVHLENNILFPRILEMQQQLQLILSN